MIDVVYVLGTGSRFHNNEIRFSLRSIEKHLKNYGKIWVIGEKHPVLQNVNHIPFPDKTSVSDTNIMYKITRACQEEGITDDFLFFNDDHYLLTDFDAQTFPFFRNNTIYDYLKKRNPDPYHRRVKNTGEYLKSKGLPTRFFDIHTPIIFNKQKFIEHVTNGPDWILPNHYVLKSIYANALGIVGVEHQDQKTEFPPTRMTIFSTKSHVKGTIQRFMCETFPNKCKFEIRDF